MAMLTLRHEKVSPSEKVRLSVQLRCMSREDPQKLTWHNQVHHVTPHAVLAQ